MGNDYSKGKKYEEAAKFGQIYIETDKPAYLAGENVTGKIYLNLYQPYPGNQIVLKLKGKEFVSIVHQRDETYYTEERQPGPGSHTEGEFQVKFETSRHGENESLRKDEPSHLGEGEQRRNETPHPGGQGQGQTRRVQHTRKVDELVEDKCDIIKLRVPVYQWPTLVPGQYTIPFNFLLPNNIPSSFFQEGYRYLAHISYQLEASLEPFNDQVPKPKHKLTLVVRQPITNQVQCQESEITTPLTTCCCCSRGSNKLKVHFEKNCYMPGERANVVVQLDNTESKLENQKIEFSFIQKLNVKARSHTINKHFIKEQRNLQGVAAGSQNQQSQIEIVLPLFQAENPKHAKRKNLKEYLLALKEESEYLNPATRGRLTTSQYFLRVSCPMDGCCSDTPIVECPVEIYYPDVQIAPVYAPTNWAPQVINPVNLSFGYNQQTPYVMPEKGMNYAPDQSLMQNQSNSTNYQSISQNTPGQY